jgi:glycosyltransferase involved in cell wall biosynthesis
MRTLLIEPHAVGRISGGYLYNQRMADGVSVRRHAVRLDSLEADLSRLQLAGPGWVLIDSLFLRSELSEPFFALRRPGLGLGVLLHALPSFIERAGQREVLQRALPLRASAAELALLERLDLLVAPGPYVPRLLGEQGSKIRCLVCPPGVDRPSDSAPPAQAELGDRQLRLVSLGGVSPLKGFADGLRALGACRSRRWRWSIVGSHEVAPEYVAELLRLRSELGLEEQVHLVGQLDHGSTLALLGQSDALLIPSFTENAPLVALEALAAGVPVVGYAVGGLPELVRDGEAGLLAPLLDVQGLTERLREIIEDDAARARLARGALSAGRGLRTWSEAARDFAAALAAAPPGAAIQ